MSGAMTTLCLHDFVMTKVLLIPLLASLGALASTGCATHFIPNTDVVDNADNRRIVAFCENYRRAVERKDLATLINQPYAEQR